MQRIADHPDPRLGHIPYEALLRPGADDCPSGWVDDEGRCLFALTQRVHSALTGSGAIWNTTDEYSAYPRWVRQDLVINWRDGVASDTKYRYEAAQQNGAQFGNVTWRQETNSGRRLITMMEYFPNEAAHIGVLPARVRKVDVSNNLGCLAETRYIYGAWYDSAGYHSNTERNFQTAPTTPLLVKQESAVAHCPGLNEDANAFGGSVPLNIARYAPDWAVTRYAYDRYGNQTSENHTGVDSSDDLVLTTVYDSVYHRFPVLRYNQKAQIHQESAFYYGVNRSGSAPTLSDSRAQWGALAEWCGVNEVCSRYGYDAFGRLQYQWDGVPNADNWSNQSAANATLQKAYRLVGACPDLLSNAIIEWRAPRSAGNFTRRIYNGIGQLIQVQSPQDGWQGDAFTCNPSPQRAEVDLNYAYDARGNQIGAGVPVATTANWVNRGANWGSGSTATTYDIFNRPSTVVAPNGETTTYKYVARSTRVVAVGQGSEQGTDRVIKWTEVDGWGNLARISTWQRPWQSGDQPTATVWLTHDPLGNLRKVEQEEANGRRTLATIDYDLAGHKVAMDDADLGYWRYGYDRQGKLVRQSDARQQATCLYYDDVARLAGKYFTDGATCPSAAPSYQVSYLYDSRHNVAFNNRANRAEMERSRGQLTKVTNAGYSKELYYNAQGLLRREMVTIAGDPATYATDYAYDAELRPYATTYPDGETVKTTYNSMGLPNLACAALWRTDKEAYWCDTSQPYLAQEAHYDEAGRLTALHFPAAGPSASSGQGLWQTRGYHGWTATNNSYPGDGNGRLDYIHIGTSNDATAASWARLQLSYHYDSFGNVKSFYDNNANNTFSYDVQNRVTYAYGKIYSYDNTGRLTTYEGASQPANNNFPLHAIKGQNLDQGSTTNGTVKIRARGSYANGWPTMQLWVNGVQRQQWTVNTTSWGDYSISVPLTGRDQIDVVFTNDYYQAGVADRNLFVDWIQVNGATYQERVGVIDRGGGNNAFDGNDILPGRSAISWNAALRFVVGSGGTAMGYDANGNLSYKLQPGQATVYEWDHENHLTTVKRNGATLESYLYDDSGQRIKKTSNGVDTYYVNPLYEVSGGVVTKYYYFGGQRIAMKRGNTLTYLHADHLGSTVLETVGGIPTADQKYFAYGNQRDTGAVATEHKFTGQKLDGTGLQYFNARYYDPTIGAFVSPDTIVPDGTNVFAYNRFMYAVGNPLNRVDPSGHMDAIMEGGSGFGGLPVSSGMVESVANDIAQLVVSVVSLAVVFAPAPAAAPAYQESVPLPEPTIEISPFPTTAPAVDQTGDAPTIGMSGTYQETVGFGNTVLADPLAETPSADELIVDIKWLGQNAKIQGVGSSGNTKGYTRATSDLPGGLGGAIEAYEALTGSLPLISNPQSLAPTDIYIEVGKIEVYFRPNSRSGTAVLEIIDHGNKTNEKIHFN